MESEAFTDSEKEAYHRRWNENRNMNFRQRKARDAEEEMQHAMKQKDESLLCPFVFEGEDEHEVCEVSVEHKDGWKAISTLIDSGASDSVAPPGMFPEVKVLETNASRAGVQYTAAGGHKIPNLGMSRPVVYTTDGECNVMTFQLASISKPLASVSKIAGKNHRVVFEEPKSYIQCKSSGKKTYLRPSGGVYFLDVWMKVGDHLDSQGFRRQTP